MCFVWCGWWWCYAFFMPMRAISIQMIVSVTLSFFFLAFSLRIYHLAPSLFQLWKVFPFYFVLVARKTYILFVCSHFFFSSYCFSVSLPIYLSFVPSLLLCRSVDFIQSLWPSFSHSQLSMWTLNMSLCWQLRNCSLMMFLKISTRCMFCLFAPL